VVPAMANLLLVCPIPTCPNAASAKRSVARPLSVPQDSYASPRSVQQATLARPTPNVPLNAIASPSPRRKQVTMARRDSPTFLLLPPSYSITFM
jgi:hypothetical protein